MQTKDMNCKIFYQKLCIDINKIIHENNFNVPNLMTNNTNFPIIGCHSTISENLDNILTEGFSCRKGDIYGETPDWQEAIFSCPFVNNLDKIPNINDNSYTDGICLSNGILRTIRQYEKNKEMIPEYISFPIIVCCFSAVGKMNLLSNWICSYEPVKQIHILGVIMVKVASHNVTSFTNPLRYEWLKYKPDFIVKKHAIPYALGNINVSINYDSDSFAKSGAVEYQNKYGRQYVCITTQTKN